MFTAQADALTLEAQKAIEEMRARLNAGEQVADASMKLPEYIPGAELASAMNRLRQRLYGIDATQIAVIAPEKTVETAPEAAPVEDLSAYIPGTLLAKAMEKIRTSQGTDNVQIAAVVEQPAAVQTVEEAPVAPENTPETKAEPVVEAPVAAEPVVVETPAAKAEPVEAVKPVNEKKQKKSQTGKKSSNKKKKGQTVVKKTSQVVSEAASQKSIDKTRNAKDETARPEDQEFNEFIRKYDFKMPENYRIIVR